MLNWSINFRMWKKRPLALLATVKRVIMQKHYINIKTVHGWRPRYLLYVQSQSRLIIYHSISDWISDNQGRTLWRQLPFFQPRTMHYDYTYPSSVNWLKGLLAYTLKSSLTRVNKEKSSKQVVDKKKLYRTILRQIWTFIVDEGQVGNDRREATCYHPIKIGKNEQWKYENSRRARNNNKSTGQEITRKLSRQQNERRETNYSRLAV